MMRRHHLIFLAFLIGLFLFPLLPTPAMAAGEFIMTIKTDNPGDSDDRSFEIPTTDGLTYDYDIDWGDGATTEGATGNTSHTYVESGTYQIKISGTFPAILFLFDGDKDKLLSIDQWGIINWQQFGGAFAGCSNLAITATDAPDLSDVLDLSFAFRATGLTTESLNDWDVSNVLYYIGTFQDTYFNGDISDWEVNGAINLSAMFYNAIAFNQDLSGWELDSATSLSSMFALAAAFNNGGAPMTWGSHTHNVQDMSIMFYGDTAFNQDVSGWDVSQVTNMNSMFEGATSFNNGDATNAQNHPLSWGSATARVTNMQGMFTNAAAFNQAVSSWDTSSTTAMGYIFSGATLFNQDVSTWNVEQVTSLDNAFTGTALSTRHYDALLKSWSRQSVQASVALGVGVRQYCDAASRLTLTSAPYSWTITDGGQQCPTAPTSDFTAATPLHNASMIASAATVGLETTATGLNYSLVDFDQSLRGWWRFEYDSTDDSTHHTDGVWSGTTAYTIGNFGYAGDFNGASSVGVDLGQPLTSSFTISAWVKLDQITEGAAIVSDSDGHLLQIGGSDRWQFADTYSADAVATMNVWTHVVGVYDADAETETLYVNGEMVSDTYGTKVIEPQLYIGKRDDNIYIDGKIDDVALFSRALDATEIAALYDSSAYTYSHIFTGLSSGGHYFQGYTVDGIGVMATTTERQVTLVAAPSARTPSSSIRGRVTNLLALGNEKMATALQQEWASLFSGVSTVTTNTSSTTSPFVFTRYLRRGMTGADVRALQIFLNQHGFQITANGAGAPGQETTFFGELTRLALARFQAAHKITPAVGYFGALTKSAVEALIAQ
ncbi:MAG: BspA family leucine-rich repeat surface protein [Candidatus Buchananbacteria bacterium]|nr:BspA family leucine-rich repeat surface protein [Candidatus Buchananbacteria bacterium]